MVQFNVWFSSILLGVTISSASAQVSVKTTISENTPISDKATGKRISFREYRELTKPDFYAYYLEPVYDEYGQASSYKLRPTTALERDTHMFDYRDSTLRLNVGQEVPLFFMKGPDNKKYRSTDLKGQVVVLSFWIGLDKPFWSDKQAESYAKAVQPYPAVSLGIINNSRREVLDRLANKPLPFIPIPDSYGFARKFQIVSSPAYIVIDKAGRVADVIETGDEATLKTVLAKVTQ